MIERDGVRVSGGPLESSLAAVRSEFYRGYSFLYMGEFYCVGTVGGPALSTEMMMDSVVFYLSRSSAIAQFTLNSNTTYHRPSFVFQMTASATLTHETDTNERDDRGAVGFSYVRYRRGNLFVSGAARFETNESLGLVLRSEVGGQVGQRFVNTNRAQLETGAGLVVTDEEAVDSESRQNVEGVLTFKYSFYAYNRPQTNVDVAVQKTPFGIGQTATVTFSGCGVTDRACRYGYASRYFHPIEFECDTVEGAVAPDAPLSIEPAAIEKVFRYAGFNVGKSGGDGVIPTAGADAAWSDMELHDAMQVYWSRFASRARRAMWVLTAARHESGTDVLGVMFDDVGPNNRPGAALFHEAFIRGAPAGDLPL